MKILDTHLEPECSVLLKPSQVGGTGVFAAKPIPKGSQVFHKPVSKRILSIKQVPEDFLKYVIYIDDETCMAPERFDHLESAWFFNHSQSPNVLKTEDALFITLRDLDPGEELFIDYRQLGEPEHLRESYYR